MAQLTKDSKSNSHSNEPTSEEIELIILGVF